jgi:penicillin-binding protein 1C
MMDRCRRICGLALSRVYRGFAFLFASCRRHRRILAAILFVVALAPLFIYAVCDSLFPFPWEKFGQLESSIRVTDRSGRLMMEQIGRDGQRRRPVSLQEISPWLTQAVVAIEDERFESHGGVDLCAVFRAVGQNVWARRTVSGASTITMQLCKMLDERPRHWRSKFVEAFRAVQLEQHRSKSEILLEYLNLIPCGGNLRGVEAAAQAYFGKSAAELSLAESALIAGLPQSPNRYAPDRHPEAALRRRDSVLRRMRELNQITPVEYEEALREPLSVRSRAVQSPAATHAAWMALSMQPRGGQTTIDLDLQRQVEAIVHDHVATLPEAADAAVVVLDVERGEILALVGSADEHDHRDGQVNGATARRSPGSALKPFLYAAAFDAKRLSPDSIVDDIPIERAGWVPENFDRTHRGQIAASEALRQSLNVPAITLTEGLGLPRSLGVLASVGLRLPIDAESRGGLAVATGGLEVSLLDLTSAYATLARDGIYRDTRLMRDQGQGSPSDPSETLRVLDANACRAITAILSAEHRCPRGWESRPEGNRPWFSWKTGTSSGRRDALAVGHNGRYAIGVWVGFFHGASHLDFVGRDAAEPILASLFGTPSLRGQAAAPAFELWPVRNPLPQPVEAARNLTILSPRNNSAFLAWNGSTVIHPSAASREQITWFHNGRVLDAAEASRLVLPRGSHELRAVAASGQSDAVRFVVK